MFASRLCLGVRLLSWLLLSWWTSSHYVATDYIQSQHLYQLQFLLLATAYPFVSEMDLNISKKLLHIAVVYNTNTYILWKWNKQNPGKTHSRPTQTRLYVHHCCVRTFGTGRTPLDLGCKSQQKHFNIKRGWVMGKVRISDQKKSIKKRMASHPSSWQTCIT